MDKFIIRSRTGKPLRDFWNPTTKAWQQKTEGCVFSSIGAANQELAESRLIEGEIVPYLMLPGKPEPAAPVTRLPEEPPVKFDDLMAILRRAYPGLLDEDFTEALEMLGGWAREVRTGKEPGRIE